MDSDQIDAQALQRAKQEDTPSQKLLRTKGSSASFSNQFDKNFPKPGKAKIGAKSRLPQKAKGINKSPSTSKVPYPSPSKEAQALQRSKQNDRPSNLQQQAENKLASYGDQYEQKALHSAEALKSSVDLLRNGLSKEQAIEYGERLGKALDKKINEGSSIAMIVALLLAAFLDASDILLLPLDAFIVTIFVKSGVQLIIWTAVMLIIRKHISFFRRRIYKRIIKLIIIPIFIQPIPFINFTPVYVLLMVDVILRRKKSKQKAIYARREIDTTLKSIKKGK